MKDEQRDWCLASGSLGLEHDLLIALGRQKEHQLPRAGLWAVSALRGLLALGVLKVEVRRVKRSLHFQGTLGGALTFGKVAKASFATHGLPSSKTPLQTALLQALEQGCQVQMEWMGQYESFRLRVGPEREPEVVAFPSRRAKPGISLRIRQPPDSWWRPTPVDFSSEIEELCLASSLVPVPVRIEGQPIDLSSQLAQGMVSATDFRRFRARDGSKNAFRVSLPVTGDSTPPALRRYGEPVTAVDAFHLFLSIDSEQGGHLPLANWVKDGICIGREPLFPAPYPLKIDAYLPAQGLRLGKLGYRLPEGKERARRLEQARFLTALSLKTVPPLLPVDQADEINARLRGLLRHYLAGGQLTPKSHRKVRHAIKAFSNELEVRERAAQSGLEKIVLSGLGRKFAHETTG